MKSLSRRAHQRHRLNRVWDFAYSHIADELDLDKFADIASLSKFHFARVFNEHFRESPIQFLWRIRLERAARNLIYQPNESITQIALDAGFSNPQSFSQVFQKRFHISPRAFKKYNSVATRNHSQRQRPEAIVDWPAIEVPQMEWAELPVRIEVRPEYRVAYIRHIGPYIGEHCRIPKTHRLLEDWARKHNLLNDNTVGISLCPDHSAFTPSNHCIYDAGIAVPDDFPEDEIVSIQTIPGGTYAVLKVKCEAEKMEYVWEWLTSVWLPSSGKTREVVPSYEYYLPTHNQSIDPQNGVELCIKLKPKRIYIP